MKKVLFICIGIIILAAGCVQPSTIITGPGDQPGEQTPVMDVSEDFVLVAVGDIMLARGVGARIGKTSIEYPFEATKEYISEADIAFGNLETALATGGTKLPGKGICFRAAPQTAEGLKNAGFDILSIANNHILDYDGPALTETMNTLDSQGIGYVGAGEDLNQARQPLIIVKDGVKVGFLAYNEFYSYYYSYAYRRSFEATEQQSGTAPMKEEIIKEDLERLKGICDIIVVSLHWGTEDSNNTNHAQKILAHKIIDWGADVILGHHPHVLQGLEFYKGKLIAYSMGNFIFDQNDENNKQGTILKINFKDNSIEEVSALPIYVKDKIQPVLPGDGKREYIIDKIIKLSNRLGTKGIKYNDRAVFMRR